MHKDQGFSHLELSRQRGLLKPIAIVGLNHFQKISSEFWGTRKMNSSSSIMFYYLLSYVRVGS